MKNRPKIQNEYPSGQPGSDAEPADKPRIGIYRRRGGQPGNQNAAKRGWYTKDSIQLRANIKDVLKRANELVARVDEQYGLKRKRGRPRKNL